MYNINIGYGHSSTFNPANNQIYFYGGLLLTSAIPNSYDPIKTLLFDTVSDNLFINSKSSSSSSSSSLPLFASAPNSNTKFFTSPQLSSHLYAYNLDTFEFKQLAKSIQLTYMHVALISHNKLLIYGGINIEASSNWFSSFTTSNQFVSNQLRIYSIDENRWVEKLNLDGDEGNQQGNHNNNTSTEEGGEAIAFKKRQRYAHTAFLNNDSMHIFAGFNGFFLKVCWLYLILFWTRLAILE